MVDKAYILIESTDSIITNFYTKDEKASAKRKLLGLDNVLYDRVPYSRLEYIIGKCNRVAIINLDTSVDKNNKYFYYFDDLFRKQISPNKITALGVSDIISLNTNRSPYSLDKIQSSTYNAFGNKGDILVSDRKITVTEKSKFLMNLLYSLHILFPPESRKEYSDFWQEEIRSKVEVYAYWALHRFGTTNRIQLMSMEKIGKTNLTSKEQAKLHSYLSLSSQAMHGLAVYDQPDIARFNISGYKIDEWIAKSNKDRYCMTIQGVGSFVARVFNVSLKGLQKMVNYDIDTTYDTGGIERVNKSIETYKNNLLRGSEGLMQTNSIMRKNCEIVNKVIEKSNRQILLLDSHYDRIVFSIPETISINEAYNLIMEVLDALKLREYFDILLLSDTIPDPEQAFRVNSPMRINNRGHKDLNIIEEFIGTNQTDRLRFKNLIERQ